MTMMQQIQMFRSLCTMCLTKYLLTIWKPIIRILRSYKWSKHWCYLLQVYQQVLISKFLKTQQTYWTKINLKWTCMESDIHVGNQDTEFYRSKRISVHTLWQTWKRPPTGRKWKLLAIHLCLCHRKIIYAAFMSPAEVSQVYSTDAAHILTKQEPQIFSFTTPAINSRREK